MQVPIFQLSLSTILCFTARSARHFFLPIPVTSSFSPRFVSFWNLLQFSSSHLVLLAFYFYFLVIMVFKLLMKREFLLSILNKISCLVPPSFTIVPRGAAEPSGSSPVYNCQASGDPVPRISWTKVGSGQTPTEQLRNGSLWIKNIQKADEGRYTCLASNKVKIITKEITISVFSKFIRNTV